MIISNDQFIDFIRTKQVKFVDLRFTDIKGQEQHITIPHTQINNHFLKNGKIFDGSSFKGWKDVHESDMILIPDLNNFIIDPFCQDSTVIVRCDIFDPNNMQSYNMDPRSIAKRAESFLLDSDIADVAMFGAEPEFFLFDDVRFRTSQSGCQVSIDDYEAPWNNNKIYHSGNKGHRPHKKSGYGAVSPVDSAQNLRSIMSLTMEQMGLIVEAHHHEVAAPGQNEIATRFNTLTKKADEIQIYKYIVRNTANKFGKTATFMPKPIVHDNGSGMHCHISLFKKNINLFSGKEYGNLSEIALLYIGGILKHAKSLNAITNPTTNSYKRLVPGYEAPVALTYSVYNRSSAIRIPLITDVNTCRIEIRFPDPCANPYLAFAALLMAGIDGVINKIYPDSPIEKNLYTIDESERKHIPYMAQSLNEALKSLHKDHQFLTKNDVFTEDCVSTYISLRQEEDNIVNATPHPIEFDLYYSI